MVTGFNVYIRVEGNSRIGLGHVGRCLAIAEALKESGIKATFALSSQASLSVISQHGFDCIVCDKTIGKDADLLRLILVQDNADLLIVDSYCATDSYLYSLRSVVPVFAFCENRDYRGSVDIACDYGFGADNNWFEEKYGDTETLCLVGSQYAPLQRVFWDAQRITIRKNVTDLLITSGGTDPYNICATIGERLALSYKDVRIHIAIGSFFMQLEVLESLAISHESIILHKNALLSTLLPDCDIVVSAAGTTVYEVMRLGVPAVFYSFVDNQAKGQKALEKFNYIGDIRSESGGFDDSKLLTIDCCVHNLLNSYEARRNISKLYETQVDGQGARRIAFKLIEWLYCHEKES